jgi:hypothetical protein
MAVRPKPLLALAVLVLALALAAPGGAQQTPTLGAPDTQTATAAPPPDDTSTTGDGGLKTWQQVLIFGAGLVLLGGIGFAIVGDARERTRSARAHGRARAAAGVPHKHSQQAKQRARAKARAGEGAAAQEPLRCAAVRGVRRAARVGAPGRPGQAAARSPAWATRRGETRSPLRSGDGPSRGRQQRDALYAGAAGPTPAVHERHACPGRQARAVRRTKARRRPLALAGRVATPDVRERLKSSGGDEREAQAARPTARLAVDRVRDGDAVIAADRLAQDAIVGHGGLGLQQRAALGARDRALQLAGARGAWRRA